MVCQMAERSKPTATDKNPWSKVAEANSAKQGWYRATFVMDVSGGKLYLTTTEHRATQPPVGRVLACSESVVFVPTAMRKSSRG